MLFGAELPSALDANTLRIAAVVIILAVIAVSVALTMLITRTVTRVVVLGVGAILVITLWNARADFGECATSCTCRPFGQEITVATCRDKL